MAPLNASSAAVLDLPRHFLFMLPSSTTEAERHAVIDSARRLTTQGYVYIASAHERTMEDREEIRFLPLNVEMLPCFGSVTAVCVLREQAIVDAAREAYPNAEVMVIDPLSLGSESVAAAASPVSACLPSAPWWQKDEMYWAEVSQAA